MADCRTLRRDPTLSVRRSQVHWNQERLCLAPAWTNTKCPAIPWATSLAAKAQKTQKGVDSPLEISPLISIAAPAPTFWREETKSWTVSPAAENQHCQILPPPKSKYFNCNFNCEFSCRQIGEPILAEKQDILYI